MNPDLITALTNSFSAFEATLTQTASDTNALNGLKQNDDAAALAITAAQKRLDDANTAKAATADAVTKQVAQIAVDNQATASAAKTLSDAALAISTALTPVAA